MDVIWLVRPICGYAARRRSKISTNQLESNQWNENMIRAYQFLDIFRLVISYNDDIVMQVILSLLGDAKYSLGWLNKSGRFHYLNGFDGVKAKIYYTIHYSHIYLYIPLTRMFSSQKQPAMRRNTPLLPSALKDLLAASYGTATLRVLKPRLEDALKLLDDHECYITRAICGTERF